jgi:hypothetical protein
LHNNFVIPAWGSQAKLTSGVAAAVDTTNGHFLSTISSDLIYCMFGSMITHEPNKMNTIGTRISSQSAADVWMHKSSSTFCDPGGVHSGIFCWGGGSKGGIFGRKKV